ncbi:hypothetical protein PsorP6_016217 [Peronosclerospora sorghi]|uniref:Uncharacterized protein n=1 Tax=Peronosclerospora sorghi TaxID=230839 RepID=A0ACC0VPY9_9STRA|nr:hypothetical protein PsorP6_016217 [Peronosclerospora sorghi]
MLRALPSRVNLRRTESLGKLLRGHNSYKNNTFSAHELTTGLSKLQGTSRRFFATNNTDMPLHFDTHHVVKTLQNKGFRTDQAEAILDVMKDAMDDSLEAQSRILATKSEHIQLKAELSERVFNSTLKFDIAQRHSRELLERDFNTLKQDIRMLEKIDFDKIRKELTELEKKFLLQKQDEDETLNELRLSMEKVEKRMLQYAVGFAGTIMAVGAALLRLVL